jgi:hypothetical protein
MSPPTAKLPLELECEIFETAAWSCREDSQLRLNLSLVARRVHVWSERIFLQVVALQDGTHAEKFLQLVDWKLTGFFANVVRALFIPYSVTAENASKILSACPGVRILACWVNYWSAPELPLLISRLPLSRLKIELRHFLSIPLDTSAWRSTLTHLDLTFWRHADDPPDLSCLGKLLRLTHVTLANPPPRRTLLSATTWHPDPDTP